MREKLKEILFIIAGTGLMAAAVNIVYEPMGMVTGGFSGIGIVAGYLTQGFHGGIPVWITNAILNIPLFFVACRHFGKWYVGKSLFATASFTLLLTVIPVGNLIGKDYLLSAVTGGVLTGAGLGLVYSQSSCSTGGTDLLGSLLNLRFRQYSTATILMVVDSMIVLLGAALFGLHHALYAVIAVYITSRVMDTILEGLHFAKTAFIISDEYEDILVQIEERLGRGATLIPAKGAYLRQEKQMLFCVVTKKEISVLVELVKSADNCAFLIIADAKEVLGEGFMEY